MKNIFTASLLVIMYSSAIAQCQETQPAIYSYQHLRCHPTRPAYYQHSYSAPYYNPYQAPARPHRPYGEYHQDEQPCAYNIQAMNHFDFDQLKQSLGNIWFESTKLEVLKNAIRYNYFNTFQVVELMNLFTFESSKLVIAESMYAQTIDKQNYYRLSNDFTFSSSIDELNQYIASR